MARAKRSNTAAARTRPSAKQVQTSARLAKLLGAQSKPGALSAADLRHNSAEVLSRVALGGERIMITRNRKPVAALVPYSDYETLKKGRTK